MSPLQSQKRPSRQDRVRMSHPVSWMLVLALVVLIVAVLLDSLSDSHDLRVFDSSARLSNLGSFWDRHVGRTQATLIVTTLLIVAIYAFRRFRQALLVRRPGPIDVAVPVNATGADLNIEEITASLRAELDRVDLRYPAPIPGGGQSADFLDVLKSTEGVGTPIRTAAALLGLARVSHALQIVTTLRSSATGTDRCGMTVNVVTLPRGSTTSHTVWAPTWEQAAHEAAMAAGAAILPMTRLCRLPPWREWRQRHLPPELFADYLDGKRLASEHRYDEALGKYYSALRHDPKNLFVRLEIGALQEQLHLFLDALETYDDLIALGSRTDERRYQRWRELRQDLDRSQVRARERSADQVPRHPVLGVGWLGLRGSRGVRAAASFHRDTSVHDALLIARYRYAMVLGFSEVVLKQWIAAPGHEDRSRRDAERKNIRIRLFRRLSRYPYSPVALDVEGRVGTEEVLRCVTPTSDWTLSGEQLEVLSHRLLALVRRFKTRSSRGHDCAREHGEEFGLRLGRANAWQAGHLNDSPRVLHEAARSIIATIQLCRSRGCDKTWDAEDAEARTFAAHEGLARTKPHEPSAEEILRAQALVQQAARRELQYLIEDYRWFALRRRPGMTVTQRALKLSYVWAGLRNQRVVGLLQLVVEEKALRESANRDAAARSERVLPQRASSGTPGRTSLRAQSAVRLATRGRVSPGSGGHDRVSVVPPVASVRKVVEGLAAPLSHPSWQDHYVCACVYAVPLLPVPSWTGRAVRTVLEPELSDIQGPSKPFAELAVRSLERSMDSSASTLSASTRAWVMSEDPDLVGVRGTREFVNFRRRNFPGLDRPVPLPRNIHTLQLSTYVTQLMLAIAAIAVAELRVFQRRAEPSGARELSELMAGDRRLWLELREVAREGRDWRVRLNALQLVTSSEYTPYDHIPYPRYPDVRIGGLGELSDPESETSATTGATHAIQERAVQLERLADIMADWTTMRLATDVGWLEGRDARDRSELVARRAQVWETVSDLLGISFFTDDYQVLMAQKRDSTRLERKIEQLASAEDVVLASLE